MNLNDHPAATLPHSVEAEQAVLGALLLDNNAIDRVPDLKAEHFYDYDHARVFSEMAKQIASGKRCDSLTLFDAMNATFSDCLPYLTKLQNNTPSAANIVRYSEIVIDRAIKREVIALSGDMQAAANGNEQAAALVERMAAKIDELAQKKTTKEPQRMSDMLSNYVDLIQARMDGNVKPIHTGFPSIDERLGGGFSRGTLVVVAGRPAMGKTAFGLCLARNVSEWGTALFLSMEMSQDEVNDRNISALGKIPLAWLRTPTDDTSKFNGMTHAFQKSSDMSLFIDDQTGLNLLEIRHKARSVKRKNSLDILVIDQLSFITGSNAPQQWEAVGEYTRGLMAIAKEMDIVVVLLCQLNRELEKRTNKRPQLSDLAMSGSIEQDANTIIFLYRDEIYDLDSREKGVCEVSIAKQRQGQPGVGALAYIGDQTRFEELAYQWKQAEKEPVRRRGGFD
jgi:replicative DNA helicase